MKSFRIAAAVVAVGVALCSLTACTGTAEPYLGNMYPPDPTTFPVNESVQLQQTPWDCGVSELVHRDGSIELQYGAFFSDPKSLGLELSGDGYGIIDAESASKLFEVCDTWTEKSPSGVVRSVMFYVGPNFIS